MKLDENGYATSTAAQANKLTVNTKYYVKEKTNPNGTYLNTKVYTVKATSSATTAKNAVRLNTVNKPWRIRVRVHKKDKTTGEDLFGVEFTIYQWNGKKYVVATDVGNNGVIKTNSSGEVSTGWLYYTKKNQGKWRITETKALPGYQIDKKATKDYQIKKSNAESSEEEPLYWEVENYKNNGGYISVQKKVLDSNGKDISSDYDMTATFTVYSDASLKKAVTTITTSADKGYGISKEVPEGTYYVKETSWSVGYEPADKNAYQKVTVVADTTSRIEAAVSKDAKKVGNQVPWYAGLSARKTDAVTGEPLSGAYFTFYEWNGKEYKELATRISGDDGIAKIEESEHIVRYTKINEGRFAVKETKAPEDYQIDDAEMRFVTINASNKGKLIDFGDFTDTKYGKLEITKIIVDALGNKDTSYDFSSIALGISYGLYYDENCIDAVPEYESIRLEKNGHYITGNLEPGTYYLRENTLNNALFSNKAGLSMKIEIYPGATTCVDGEKGISYDGGKTWDNIW